MIVANLRFVAEMCFNAYYCFSSTPLGISNARLGNRMGASRGHRPVARSRLPRTTHFVIGPRYGPREILLSMNTFVADTCHHGVALPALLKTARARTKVQINKCDARHMIIDLLSHHPFPASSSKLSRPTPLTRGAHRVHCNPGNSRDQTYRRGLPSTDLGPSEI